jgi:hypothetical protein
MRARVLTKENRKWLRSFIKDFGGLIVACIALILSSYTLYESNHVVDDFRFTIGNDDSIPNPDPTSKRIILYGPRVLTFINSGTRPIATLGVQLLIYQVADKDAHPQNCPLTKSAIVKTSIAPFVTKASEIQIQPLAFDRSTGLQFDDSGHPMLELKDDMYWTVLCLMFDLAMPDNVPSSVLVPLTSSEYSTPPYGGSEILYTPSRPITLLPRRPSWAPSSQ